jgi:hypothetical protein
MSSHPLVERLRNRLDLQPLTLPAALRVTAMAALMLAAVWGAAVSASLLFTFALQRQASVMAASAFTGILLILMLVIGIYGYLAHIHGKRLPAATWTLLAILTFIGMAAGAGSGPDDLWGSAVHAAPVASLLAVIILLTRRSAVRR